MTSAEHSKQNPWPLDAVLLAGLSHDERVEFEQYMDALDDENITRLHPYGEGSLWGLTGAQCWYDYFNDGISPADAMDEDLSFD